MQKIDLISKINQKILDSLDKGIVPWHKPWVNGIPSNYISKRPYHNQNFVILCSNEYPSPYYLSYLQTQQLGGKIKSGSKGHMIIFWKIINKIMDRDGESKLETFPLARLSYVFNLSQTTLWDDEKHRESSIVKHNNPIDECEQFINTLFPAPVIVPSLKDAALERKEDKILIPPITNFDTAEHYYAALFHEIIHWTGQPNRLNRDMEGHFGDTKYSFEELVAEIGSSYLCGVYGISPKVVDNSLSYINGWAKEFKRDPNIIMKASKLAFQAVEFLLPEHKSEINEAA